MPQSLFQWKISTDKLVLSVIENSDFDSTTMQLPAGLYTTFRTWGQKSRVLGLQAHLDRLFASSIHKKVEPVRSQSDLRQLVHNFAKEIPSSEVRVRLILDTTIEKGTLYILMQSFELLPESIYKNGVFASVSDKSRVLPILKQTNFILESMNERKEKKDGVFEILLTHDNRILEGMTSNFFYVKGGVLYTAIDGILNGVTREAVLRLAKEMQLIVKFESLHIHDIAAINEAFITSSSRGVVPVVRIADQSIGAENVGDVTSRLQSRYDAQVLSIAEIF